VIAQRLLTLVLFLAAVFSGSTVMAASSMPMEEPGYKTSGGLTAYIGMMPAEIVKGHPAGHPEQTMHGGTPQGRHEYHLIVAIFDAASGARIANAAVTARLAGLGLSGPQEKLEPMNIANTITYGSFFDLPGADLYTIKLTIERPGLRQPVVMDFKYDHRR
jgi:hypothetical protein